MKRLSLYLLASFLISACQNPKELTPDRYIRWISSKSHGFIQNKEVKEVRLQARFLPADYQAYREFLQSRNTLSFDSILSTYGCGLAFQFTVSAEKTNALYRNLLNYDIFQQEETLARIRYLNFHIEEFITLTYADKVYKPVLSHFEGYDELGNKMTFQTSFIVPEFPCDRNKSDSLRDVTVTFDDPFWDLGTNHFLFDKKLFINSPRLKL